MSRLTNFTRCFDNLEEGLSQPIERMIEVAGAVKLFELAFETGWKALAAHLRAEGHEVAGPKSAFRVACENELLSEEERWLEMVAGRNLGVHVYDEAHAKALVARIRSEFLPLLRQLRTVLVGLEAAE